MLFQRSLVVGNDFLSLCILASCPLVPTAKILSFWRIRFGAGLPEPFSPGRLPDWVVAPTVCTVPVPEQINGLSPAALPVSFQLQTNVGTAVFFRDNSGGDRFLRFVDSDFSFIAITLTSSLHRLVSSSGQLVPSPITRIPACAHHFADLNPSGSI